MNAFDLDVGKARIGEPLAPRALCALAAQRPDIKAVAPQRRIEGGVVQLGIV
jgi:hypothetical protein